MRVASVSAVKAKFGAYVKASRKSPVVITERGKAVAAIIPVLNEEDLERILMAYNPKLRAILNASKAQIKAGLGIPEDEFWRRVDARYQKRPQRKSA
jgi:prevent-host-death family protein